jgi:hypothetical protein
MLERFNMADAKARRTPLPTGTRLVAEGDRLDTEAHPYSSLIGSLLYIAACTRPDIAFAVNALARYMSAPTEQHWLAAKAVVRYLRGTISLGITFGPTGGLTGYCDADYGGELDSRRSTTAFLFTLNRGAISWGSRLQPTLLPPQLRPSTWPQPPPREKHCGSRSSSGIWGQASVGPFRSAVTIKPL